MLQKSYKRRSNGHGSSQEHTMIVEKVTGCKLGKGVVVHHFDCNKHNNAKENLVVCQNEAYHKLLHTRTKALYACGNADWRKCWICHRYDDKSNLFNKITKGNKNGEGTWMHIACEKEYMRKYHLNRIAKS